MYQQLNEVSSKIEKERPEEVSNIKSPSQILEEKKNAIYECTKEEDISKAKNPEIQKSMVSERKEKFKT